MRFEPASTSRSRSPSKPPLSKSIRFEQLLRTPLSPSTGLDQRTNGTQWPIVPFYIWGGHRGIHQFRTNCTESGTQDIIQFARAIGDTSVDSDQRILNSLERSPWRTYNKSTAVLHIVPFLLSSQLKGGCESLWVNWMRDALLHVMNSPQYKLLNGENFLVLRSSWLDTDFFAQTLKDGRNDNPPFSHYLTLNAMTERVQPEVQVCSSLLPMPIETNLAHRQRRRVLPLSWERVSENPGNGLLKYALIRHPLGNQSFRRIDVFSNLG